MGDLESLRLRVRRARREVDRRVGEARQVALAGKAVQSEVKELQDVVRLYEKAVGVLNSIGETRQETAQKQIESLVTTGLQTIFGEQLSFHMLQSSNGKVTSVDFVVRSTLSDGRTVDTDVISARGGGLVSVVGFLLRLVVLLLSTPKYRPVLVLDETFAHLCKDYVPAMADFLRQLVDKAGVQIVMVTHDDLYLDVADKKYEFSLGSDGFTKVKEL